MVAPENSFLIPSERGKEIHLQVEEAQSMEELMLYGGDAVAATPDGQLLFTHTSVPH